MREIIDIYVSSALFSFGHIGSLAAGDFVRIDREYEDPDGSLPDPPPFDKYRMPFPVPPVNRLCLELVN